MAATKTDVMNAALAFIGQVRNVKIEDPDENTSDARTVRRFYDQTLDAFLEETWWSWATRYSVLSLNAEATPEAWGYGYALPADCVAPRRIVGVTPEEDVEYEEGISPLGVKLLYCDLSEAELEYTARVVTFDIWSGQAVRAFELALARDIAPAYTGGKKWQDVEAKYQDALERAMDASYNRGQPRVQEDNEFIEARHADGRSYRAKARYVAGS